MIQYIIKALQQKESVHVNDLGTFAIHYVSARIDGKQILPPHNEVTLDTRLEHDEIAFANFVGREKKCLLTQANNDIMVWVEELNNALENNKSVSFEGFGTFSLSDKGKITFICDHIAELNEEFEGMTALMPGHVPIVQEEIEEVAEEEKIEEEIEEEIVIQRSTILEEEETKAEEPQPVVEEVQEEEKVEEKIEEEVEEEIVIQRSTILEEEETKKEEEPQPVVEEVQEEEKVEEKIEEEEEIVIQRSTILEEEETKIEEEPQPVVEEVQTEETKTMEEPEVEPEEEVVEEEIDEEEDLDDVEDEPKKKKSRWWLWLLIVLIVLAGLGVLGYLFKDKITPTIEQLKSKFSKTEQVEPVVEAEEEEETATVEEVEVIEEVVKEEPAEEPVAESFTPQVIKSTADNKYQYIRFESGHFYVIAGSLPNEKDAEMHIRQRSLDQYNPTLLLQDGVSNIRVCIGIFNTEAEAESFAKDISSKYWVLK